MCVSRGHCHTLLQLPLRLTEINNRRLLCTRFGCEVWPLSEIKKFCEKQSWESLDGDVVLARKVVELFPFDGNAIFRALKLCHQVAEKRACFKLRIFLHNNHKPRKSA